ncbi:hypothetical protein EXIGLDRAFT_838229 [Exidia glandulosa HHB12029]|uniref:DUF7330 domain-containing protein n=1 Tax=Exidia glandulosa HHB12029 TaxID=1314781 RepID=A0A165G1C1_EXIGL|nr:hypothetical protein EXIGLDRAFT_838229 [Exidia glandulosa HHB12029]
MVAPTSSAREQVQHDVASLPATSVQAVPPESTLQPTPAAPVKSITHPPPPPIARSNWVCVARKGKPTGFPDFSGNSGAQPIMSIPEPILGSYVLDPSLNVAPELLAPMSSDDKQRPNLKIKSTGDIDVDLWVLPSTAATTTFIVLNGRTVKLRLHSMGTRPLDIRISCSGLHMQIPRDFVGALGIEADANQITFTPPVKKELAIFHDAVNGMSAFIGNSTQAGGDLPQGSKIEIESSNFVSVSFVALAKAEPFWRSLWPFKRSSRER